MKTSTLKSTLTKKEAYANWLRDNPEHPDYNLMWKEYNQLNPQTNGE